LFHLFSMRKKLDKIRDSIFLKKIQRTEKKSNSTIENYFKLLQTKH